MMALPGQMNTIPTSATLSCESSFLSPVKLLEASLKYVSLFKYGRSLPLRLGGYWLTASHWTWDDLLGIGGYQAFHWLLGDVLDVVLSEERRPIRVGLVWDIFDPVSRSALCNDV